MDMSSYRALTIHIDKENARALTMHCEFSVVH